MDYLKLITDKETELQPLYDRMDADAEVFDLVAYQMLGVGGKRIDKAYHVTMPDPKQYLEDVVAKLTSVRRQVVVKSAGLPEDKCSVIENWVDDIQYEADALLEAKGESAAFIQHADLVCSRGPIVEQVLLRIKNGVLIPDKRPRDSRYFAYELGDGRMEWGSAFTVRYAADIEREYPRMAGKVKDKTGEVRDFYNDKLHIVFVDKDIALEEQNSYKEPPFVLAIPQTSSARRDDNYYKNLGDSILRALRTDDGHYLFEERNYIASYLKTLSGESLFPPTQFPSPPEGDYQTPPEKVPGSGQMLQVKQPALLFPKSELSQGTALYIQTVNDAIKRGTFSALEHGIIDLPQSGVAIAQKVALQNESLLPRLNCLASLFQQSAKMAIRQFIKMGMTLELGEAGHRCSYSPAELEGDYTIQYRFYTTSQEQLAGAASIATAIAPYVSAEYIQENILMIQDPAGENVKIDMERAKKADPALDLYDQMRGFIKAQEASKDAATKDELDLQARMILSRIISILKQRRASETQPMPTNIEEGARVETKGAPGMPVFGSSGQVRSQ